VKVVRLWFLFVALLLVAAMSAPARTTARAAPPLDVSAAANVYYVAPGGSDSDPGTISRPWRTIGKAVRTLAPGDVVYIKNGQYREHVVLGWKDAGAPGKTIAYRAYPGHQPVLDGTGVGGVARGLFELTGCDYIEISGLLIRNSPKAGIHVRGSEHVTVKNNRIERSKSSGIGIWRSSDVTVEGNVLEDCVTDPKAGEPTMLTFASVNGFRAAYNEIYWTDKDRSTAEAGLVVKESSTGGWVVGNSLHDLPGTGIYVDGWDGGNHDHHISGNFIHNTNTGISMGSERGGTLYNVYIYNNIIHHMRYAGIRCNHVGYNGLRRDIYIHNNTIVGAYDHGGAGIVVETDNVSNIILTNNLINFGPDLWVGQIKAYKPSAITSTTNLVYGPKKAVNDPKLVEVTKGTITADPRFVDAVHQNFRLRSDSPARDRGTRVDLARDYVGVPRPQGTGYDIGAYEYRILGPMNNKVFVPVVVH
jgi:parallel beta-helix repeat protein